MLEPSTGGPAVEGPAAEVASGQDDGEPPPPPSPEELAEPCRPGQIKGDADSARFYAPTHTEYAAVRERVRCFQTEAQARASGFQPAP